MEYYRSHWVAIEPERLARYDALFQWMPQMEPLLEGLALAEGQRVVDYGCGPGWAALELARRIGDTGRVVAGDINEEFLVLGKQHAEEAGLSERIEWCHVTDDRLPVRDGSIDRVFCKNVLEYVPSIEETLGEFRRALKPGGIARLVDSDWDLLMVEPLGSQRVGELLASARHAYNDAQAGRHLYGAAQRAGFTDVHVQVVPFTDTVGLSRIVLLNLIGYAVERGYPQAEGKRMLEDVDRAVERRELLGVLPQFVVTAVAP